MWVRAIHTFFFLCPEGQSLILALSQHLMSTYLLGSLRLDFHQKRLRLKKK